MLFKIKHRKRKSDKIKIKYGFKQERDVKYSTKKPMEKNVVSKKTVEGSAS